MTEPQTPKQMGKRVDYALGRALKILMDLNQLEPKLRLEIAYGVVPGTAELLQHELTKFLSYAHDPRFYCRVCHQELDGHTHDLPGQQPNFVIMDELQEWPKSRELES